MIIECERGDSRCLLMFGNKSFKLLICVIYVVDVDSPRLPLDQKILEPSLIIIIVDSIIILETFFKLFASESRENNRNF